LAYCIENQLKSVDTAVDGMRAETKGEEETT